jgi:hypothetical protein
MKQRIDANAPAAVSPAAVSPVMVEARADGALLLRPTEPLGSYPVRLCDKLRHWAAVAPDRCFIARRDRSGAWQRLSYATTLQRVRALATTLLGMQLSPERPVAILSGNSLEHQLLALACSYIGVPHSPVSPAYSTISSDHSKLRHVLKLLTPGLIAAFADTPRERAAFDAAIAAAPAGSRSISELPAGSPPRGPRRGRRRKRPRQRRHHREVPADFWIHRHAQGRDHHRAHDLQQPRDGPAALCLRARAATGTGRLAAVEPRVRRQPQRRPCALHRRHAVYR